MLLHRQSTILLLAALLVSPRAGAQNQIRPGFSNAELRGAVSNAALLVDRTPEQISRDAFASPYGRAVIQDVATVLQVSADPACLQSKGLGSDTVRSVEQLLVNYGASIIHTHRAAADPQKFEAGLTARAGARWSAEISALRQDADVKKYLALREPLDRASVVDGTTEILDRYAVLARIRLSGPLYALMSRSEQVKREIPYDTAGKALGNFLSANKSPRFKRWEQLEAAATEAWLDAVSDDALRSLMRPRDLVPDFGAQLQALCVTGRR